MLLNSVLEPNKTLSPNIDDINKIGAGKNFVLILRVKCHLISCNTTIELSFKNGKASIKYIISPGVICSVSRNKKSNVIFNLTKNLWGWSPVNSFHFWVNSGKYLLTLYPVFLLDS